MIIMTIRLKLHDSTFSLGPAIGYTYSLTYECRDIGYDVETGDGKFIYRGGPDDTGKHEFEPVNGGPVIYLFEDEITELY